MQTTASITVRQANMADIAQLVPLLDAYRQFYGQASDPAKAQQFLAERFAHSESNVFVAESNGHAVGFTQLYPLFSTVSLAPVYVLNDLYVTPAQRGQGVADQLLSAAVQWASGKGAVRLQLSTAVDNHKAQAVYQRAGWQRDQGFLYYQYSLHA